MTDLTALRAEVRALLDEWRTAGRFTPQCDAWLRGNDPQFSKAVAARGWIGMTWPRPLGGSEESNRARLVVTEELLRAGAPVAAHWMGDRQIGPAILRYGSAELQQTYLPRIAAGDVTFCLGMSETESGSDLASVRTTATAVDGGFRITGRKIWTSQAHTASHIYVLARTDRAADKHAGLTEFVVDMSSVGVEVRPIFDLRGQHHFNEVTFDDVFVRADQVLGAVGQGWAQVTEQLAFERGGMERLLSTYPLLAECVRAAASHEHYADIGSAVAQLATMRRLALQVATALDAGSAPVQLAATLKDLGTTFEGEVNELGRRVLAVEPDPGADGVAELLAGGILAAPGFTIRGGTTEVLRTIIARTAGEVGRARAGSAEIEEMADDVLAGRGGEPPATGRPAIWPTLAELGWPGVGMAESRGGSGGSLADLVTLVRATGRHAVSTPLAETAWAHRLVGRAGTGAATVVVSDRLSATDGGLSGEVSRVPWARSVDRFVVVVDGSVHEVPADAAGITVTPGENLAGEPRDTVRFDVVAVGPPVAAVDADQALAEGALLRVAQLVGAAEAALAYSAAHAGTREQFGRPLIKFQAVGSLLAQMVGQVTLARAALAGAITGDSPPVDHVAAAFAVAGPAATFAARAAHQLHGAMGITREHPLHLSTRRLWSWRDEFGGDRAWARRLGRRLAGLGEDDLWDWLTATGANGDEA
jgi:alkylation response protein AidB-like acyl-CoA dehydrogenase